MTFVNHVFSYWHDFFYVRKVERNSDRMISYQKWNVRCMKNKINEKKMNMKRINKNKWCLDEKDENSKWNYCNNNFKLQINNLAFVWFKC